MKTRDQKVLQEFSHKVRSIFPDAEIWAFGSRCRDESDDFSDLDICIVLEKLDRHVWDAVSDIAWEVGFAHDIVINTVKFERDQFENGPISASPLVHSILREGKLA